MYSQLSGWMGRTAGLVGSMALIYGGLTPASCPAQSGRGQACVPDSCVPNGPQPPYCPQPYVQPPPQGQYVVPPASGELIGPSGARGLRGLRIRFPEVTLELPTIEIPGFYSVRRKPHLRTDSQVATYTTEPPVEYGNLLRQTESPAPQPLQQPEPQRAPGCVSLDGADPQRVAKLEASIAQLEAMIARLAQAQLQSQSQLRPQTQSPSPTPAHTPASQQFSPASRVTMPTTGVREPVYAEPSAQLQQQYLQKCQEVEQMSAQLDQLQRLCEAMAAAQQNQIYEAKRQRMLQQLPDTSNLPTQSTAVEQPTMPQTLPAAAPYRLKQVSHATPIPAVPDSQPAPAPTPHSQRLLPGLESQLNW